MEPLLLFPDPAPPPLAQALDLGGWPWKAAATPDAATRLEPDEGWAGAVVAADEDPDAAFALCRTLRKRDIPLEPLLLLVPSSGLADLELREDLFDDFCVAVPAGGTRGAAQASVLAHRSRHAPRARRVRSPRAEPGDVPGRHQRPAPRPDVHGVRAPEVPRHPSG